MKKLSVGREEVFKGMSIVHDYVAQSLGPNGGNVILDRGYNAPIITNDGVSICEAIEVEDFTLKQGVDLLRHGAKKQREQAGDGTTTFVVLTHALIEEGMKHPNPMEVRRSLEKAKIKVVDELKKRAKPVKTDKEILNVATIATESEEYGQMIFDIIKSIGRDGVITVEQSQDRETSVKISEGYVIEKGYSNMATGVALFKSPKVWVVGERIYSDHDLAPLLDKAVQSGVKQIVLFCTDMEPAPMTYLARLWEQKIIQVLVIKASTQNQEVLHDVALLTDATYIAQDAGYTIANTTLEMLGSAKRVVADGKQTQIVEGKGSVAAKVEELKEELSKTTDANQYDLIEKRIARLKHEVAIISVGAATEENMQYLFYKILNGVNSTKASIEEGIVAGGGYTLHQIANTLGNSVGEKILKYALKMPLKRIIENGKEDYTDILLNMPKDKGYNAKTREYVDLIKDGILDPVRVERIAVENAVSLASSFITTYGSVALIRKLEVE